MIRLTGGHRLIQSVDELPNLKGAKELFLDTETTSFGRSKMANYPYKGDRICGVAILVDNQETGYYVPVRHNDGKWNLPLEPVRKWLKDVVSSSEQWINHNVNFDAHFLLAEGITPPARLICTLTLAKVHDSDRFKYDLKTLARDWLGMPPDEQDRVLAFLKGMRSNDFADVPADILGEYAIGDVVRNRELWWYLVKQRPEQVKGIWDIETQLTSLLFEMERDGLKSDPLILKKERLRCLQTMIRVSEEIKTITGQEFVNSNDHIFDILVTQHGLPILALTENSKDEGEDEEEESETNASFDKSALALYKVHPQVTSDPKMIRLIDLITEYRKDAQFEALFLRPYLELLDSDNRLHPSYNQIVRTGRMSCRRPNGQQLNERAKRLIIPSPGNAFMSYDASQIEFRMIVHYINDKDAIDAYIKDPTTDFHQWMADQCHIKRKPGKTLNFAAGYGAGKARVTSALAKDPDVMDEIGALVNEEVAKGLLVESEKGERYRKLCAKRAEDIYTMYHERFPSLKRTSYHCANVAKIRGYVFNAFGRRRHLPAKFAHKAFNSIIQGGAMDYIKERMVAIQPLCRLHGVRIVANVHDEILFEGPIPTVSDPKVQEEFKKFLEVQPVAFRVPFLWEGGWSSKNWAEASA